MPYFTVIIPTYNRAHLIGKAIESVLAQTFSDWELVIVDDGSADNIREVVEAYSDNRVRYIYQTNAERSAARNNGISHSQGKFICFLDSDDRYEIDRLERLHSSIQEQNEPIALFFTGIKFEDGSEVLSYFSAPKKETESIYDFIIRATFATPRSCIHRDILIKHQFNPKFRIGEDTELWIRIAQGFPVIYLADQATVVITEHEDRSINLRKNNSALEQLQILRYIFKAPHPGKNISRNVKRDSLSNCYFNIAKHNMLNNKRAKSLFWILKAMFKSPLHKQNKHRLLCLSNLVVGRIMEEYK